MTYEVLVDKIRTIYEYADARNIFEHIAMQINIEGDGAGILYIEVANRAVCVEPYNYYDHDGLIRLNSHTVIELCEGRLTFKDGLESGLIKFEGNERKLKVLMTMLSVNYPKPAKPGKKSK